MVAGNKGKEMTFRKLYLTQTLEEANKKYLLCSLWKVGKTLLQSLFKHPDFVYHFWNWTAIKPLTFQPRRKSFLNYSVENYLVNILDLKYPEKWENKGRKNRSGGSTKSKSIKTFNSVRRQTFQGYEHKCQLYFNKTQKA